VKKSVAAIFKPKSLAKPGGQIYRTIGSLPDYISVDELIAAANELGFGHRIENGMIRIFARS
jgi:hypothetical protein